MERTLFEFYLELDEELPEFMNDISTIDATFSTDILRNKHRYSNGRYSNGRYSNGRYSNGRPIDIMYWLIDTCRLSFLEEKKSVRSIFCSSFRKGIKLFYTITKNLS